MTIAEALPIPSAPEAQYRAPPLFLRSVAADWNYRQWLDLDHRAFRYEIIHGVLYTTTAPSTFHQWIIKRFERFIGIPIEDQGLGIALAAPVGLLMPGCDPVQPDYVLVLEAKRHLFYNRRINGVPDLVVEVLSPSNLSLDEDVKFVAYAEAGLLNYVIVDPRTRTLRYYRLAEPGRYPAPAVFGEQDSVTFDCLPTITLKIADLFAGAPDTTL